MSNSIKLDDTKILGQSAGGKTMTGTKPVGVKPVAPSVLKSV